MSSRNNSINHPSSNSNHKLTRKEFISAAIGAATSFALTKPAYAENEEIRTIKDSLGRSINIPILISSVIPLRVNAQTLLTTLSPDMIATRATDISNDIDDYKAADLEELAELPKISKISSSESMSKSSAKKVKNASPDLIIDAGIPRKGLEEELDEIEQTTGIPCLFIDISFGKLADAYRALGEVLDLNERAEVLAQFVEDSQQKAKQVGLAKEDKPVVFYAQGVGGTKACSGIEAKLDAIKSIGIDIFEDAYDFGNEKSDISKLESEYLNLIIFDNANILEQLKSKDGTVYDDWKDVVAISQGRYAVSPALMHSWFGSFVLVQVLGILWLASIMWPKDCAYSIEEEAKKFYSLFYGLDKSESEFSELIGTYNADGYAE